MDYSYLCTNLGHLMGLQVRILQENKIISSYSNVEFLPDPVELILDKIKFSPYKADYHDTPHPLFFGSIKIYKKRITIIIGPAFSVKPGKERLHALLHDLGVSYERFDEFSFYINNIPTYPIESFLQIICFLNYYLNGEKLSVSDLIEQSSSHLLKEISAVPEIYDNTDNVKIHNTYNMERELLSYISFGKTEALKNMFSNPPTGRVGKIAHDEIRQHKNTFICSATLASRAAISGGLSHEIAFSLSDYYIQKVELLSDYQAITALNMEMLLEFAKKVEKLKINGSLSKTIIDIIRYIHRNLYGKITLDDISSNMGISRTYMCNLFKSEVGTTINAFIANQKIEEAKRLLTITDRPISSISESLNYSSQSYFQNKFKMLTGKTPNEYRSEKAH